MAAERNNSSRDIISSLPCELLSYIFGFLPFKEAARNSILSTKFRHIWHGIDRIDLQENYFVQEDETERNKMNQRREFINFAFHCWSKNCTAKTINAFSLTFTRPRNFYVETYNLIRFSVARNVKALTLDFHNPIWREDGLENHRGVFDLPVFVYSYQGFESLKLFSCNFLASEFRNYTALKELSLGWIQLGPNSVRTLLMYCPLLESFSLKKCWNIHERLDISRPNLRLKNLVVDRCNFLSGLVKIQAPNLRFFKYSGKAARFYFQSRLTYMQEAELDFGQQSEFSGVADLLYDLLDQLFSVRVLTVCSFLLQAIPIGEEPLDLLKTLNVRHLTLKTSMRSFELDGTIFMLKCCPLLETLTINNLGPARIFPDDVPPFELDPEEFWTNNLIVHRCIKTSLKVVEVLGFQGTGNENLMLQYLISFGSVLEEVNLYLSEEDDGYGGNSEKYLQIAESMQRDIQRASHRLRIYIY